MVRTIAGLFLLAIISGCPLERNPQAPLVPIVTQHVVRDSIYRATTVFDTIRGDTLRDDPDSAVVGRPRYNSLTGLIDTLYVYEIMQTFTLSVTVRETTWVDSILIDTTFTDSLFHERDTIVRDTSVLSDTILFNAVWATPPETTWIDTGRIQLADAPIQ